MKGQGELISQAAHQHVVETITRACHHLLHDLADFLCFLLSHLLGPRPTQRRLNVRDHLLQTRESLVRGFYQGAGLSDPEGLLEGTGAKLRHVKVRSVEVAEQPAVRALIEAALAERRHAQGRP